MSRVLWARAILLLALASSGSASLLAQCSSCQSGTVGSWPQADCGESGESRFAQRHPALHQWHDDYHHKAAIIAQRNNAWPKPFACHDRMAWFSVWGATYDAGWIGQCTLTDVHFNPDTGALNEAGQNKVQSIVANNPLDRRAVYILHDRNVVDTQSRVEQVRTTISKWYGPELANNVVVTDRFPQEVSGQRIQAINDQYRAQMPAPMIQTSSSGSTGSTGGSTGGGTDGG